MAEVELSALDISLEDRIAASKSSRGGGGGGAKRSDRRERRKARSSTGPYEREQRLPYSKGNSDEQWGHDLYGDKKNRQFASSGQEERGRGKVDFSGVKDLLGGGGLSVRGASGEKGRVVRIENLMEGTSAADVEAIFKEAGPVSSSKLTRTKPTVSVELVYRNPQDAEDAVRRYDGQMADGLTLRVSIVTDSNAGKREGAGGRDLLSRVGTKRDLLEDDTFVSKMRSDTMDQPGENRGSRGRRGRGRGGRS
ncbi:hypothetical protein DACRYDRAFT_119934 [Dacryopinax primogenitus]|uniref:RRM domain-containing protein n=1 Tax=Dacryopinax primogenitus (strain DJM 731) TaxID=1858805 RepID=M5FZ18_DACPD|nr:uncharacterized protein DACRYDRAFT_119934 [Dacryopinax primogenitus]EJT96722.1 hypothetical protein DACRYDRAFT_119934 [Dacryopinax primogenitus]